LADVQDIEELVLDEAQEEHELEGVEQQVGGHPLKDVDHPLLENGLGLFVVLLVVAEQIGLAAKLVHD